MARIATPKSKRQEEARRITGAIMHALVTKIYVEKMEYISLEDYSELERKVKEEVEATL